PILHFFSSTRSPPRPTLFPYTTLFRSSDAAFDSPPNSTSSQPAPSGSRPILSTLRPFAFMSLIRRSSIPSRPIGLNSSSRGTSRSEEHTSELQSRSDLVCRLLLEKKNI